MTKLILSWDDIFRRLDNLNGIYEPVYGIPRGGSIVAGLLRARSTLKIVDSPEEANFCLDDVIDSGETAKFYKDKYNLPTIALVDKPTEDLIGTWIEFPWERSEGPPRFIRESPIATWDGRYEVEYRNLKCPLDHDAPTLLIYSTRVKGERDYPYHFCSECLGLIYTISPENPVIWKPSRTATNLRARQKTVKVNLATLARSNPQVALALEAALIDLKKKRGDTLTVKEFQIWKEHNA